MAGEKEMSCCVRDYHEYKDIWAAVIGEVLVCRHQKNFHCKINSRIMFSVYENIFTTKKANYGIKEIGPKVRVGHTSVIYTWATRYTQGLHD